MRPASAVRPRRPGPLRGARGPRASGSSGTSAPRRSSSAARASSGGRPPEPLELGALLALDPRHLGVGRRGRDHGHAIDEVGAARGERQPASAGRPAGDADAPDAHAVEHGGELVRRGGHRRPGPRCDGRRAAVPRPVDREQADVPRPGHGRIGVEAAGARSAVAEDDGRLPHASRAPLGGPGDGRRRAVDGDPATRLEHETHGADASDNSRHLLSCTPPRLEVVRASRLVSFLLVLQTRGQLTAVELAERLEVSERTVQRDAQALAAAGVPIVSVRGPAGGYRLERGYRTEADWARRGRGRGLFVGPAAELGLGRELAAARLKLLASLPAELQDRAGRAAQLFHVDTRGWFREETASPSARARRSLWRGRRLDMRYREGAAVVSRRLDPLGLVLKAGVWYLLARRRGEERVYRVSRIVSARERPEESTRAPDFDLATAWAAARRRSSGAGRTSR